jgi:hypothetical protein
MLLAYCSFVLTSVVLAAGGCWIPALIVGLVALIIASRATLEEMREPRLPQRRRRATD